MNIVVAPDSFKECLASEEVGRTVASALRELDPSLHVTVCPLADGGEGMLSVLAPALQAHLREAVVSDPLGRPVRAQYGVAGKTALVETARACGLQLLSERERNPLLTSTRGVGELLLDAFRQGCRHFIVGLGGSSTCDGGEGMLSVPGIEALREATFEVLCDVRNPLVGPEGAARVFGPQKGASPAQVEVLERRMLSWADTLGRQTGVPVADVPGAGAAGGLGGAFLAYFKASLASGIGRVLDLVGFDAAVAGADAVITGEGRSDSQTLSGKVPYGVLLRSPAPVYLLSGRIQDLPSLLAAGFTACEEVSPRSLPLREALRREVAMQNLSSATKRLFQTIRTAASR